MNNVPPSLGLPAFNCPYCCAFAHQDWFVASARTPIFSGERPRTLCSSQERKAPKLSSAQNNFPGREIQAMNFSKCMSCDKVAVWIYDTIVYPRAGGAPAANPDMPEDIRRDYDEASAILDQSPRGAAALIRLAIQKLCKELGQPGKNINEDIGALVRGGLDPRVQQALDIVRVVGNSAVHPGQIDLRDDRKTAETLFTLLNMIVDKTVSEPKYIAELYASLPESGIQAIERRDGKV
ncbi:DUF4145 domain-containing protein [Tistrella mobilis]|uniref:DUF4145 domain-containing protein n=1 Tax=Tistrella mobilis TaxID=171437 RepID=UPI0035590979